jgi:hypothetical protein
MSPRTPVIVTGASIGGATARGIERTAGVRPAQG